MTVLETAESQKRIVSIQSLVQQRQIVNHHVCDLHPKADASTKVGDDDT